MSGHARNPTYRQMSGVIIHLRLASFRDAQQPDQTYLHVQLDHAQILAVFRSVEILDGQHRQTLDH